MDHVDVAVEDVRDDLRRRRLVALALRRRAERDDDLAEDVELDRRDLVVAGELEVGVDQLRLAEVVRARVERGADPEAEQLAAGGRLCPPLLDARRTDEVERHLHRPRVVARVVDAAVRRLVRHVLGLDEVLAADLDRIDPERVRDDVDHALGEPELLHARVAAVRRHGRLVRHRLGELEPDVAPLVEAGRDLRPDHAAERLVAEVRAGVVDRLRPEAEQRAVGLHRDLGALEPALVAVRHRLVELGPPLGPLDRAVELAREQAARDELRVRRDLVAEAAADVLRDDAQLVEPDAHRRAHHDRGEARELVVREHRPLARAAVVLDERAVALERRRVEAVEVELVDRDDVIGLGERRVDVAPLPDAGVREVAAAVLVEHGCPVGERLARVDDDIERLVVDHHELGRVTRQLAGLGDDGDDGLAEVAHLADGERVVLDVAAGRSGDLEERIGQDRHLVARQRAEHAGQLERGGDVDRGDRGVRVGRRARSAGSPSPCA